MLKWFTALLALLFFHQLSFGGENFDYKRYFEFDFKKAEGWAVLSSAKGDEESSDILLVNSSKGLSFPIRFVIRRKGSAPLPEASVSLPSSDPEEPFLKEYAKKRVARLKEEEGLSFVGAFSFAQGNKEGMLILARAKGEASEKKSDQIDFRFSIIISLREDILMVLSGKMNSKSKESLASELRGILKVIKWKGAKADTDSK